MRAFNKKGKPKHSTKIKYVKKYYNNSLNNKEYVLTQRCSIKRSFDFKNKCLCDYIITKYKTFKRVYLTIASNR
ncbi:MAG: hypothetical protein ACRC1T_09700 [Clostridium chrysemydis]